MTTENDTRLDKLHALADGQLDSTERKKLLAQLESEKSLRGELCEIYRVKDLLQASYPLDEFEHNADHEHKVINPFAKVAGFVLALAVALGAGYTIRDAGLIDSAGITLAGAKQQDNKYLLYLSSAEPEKYIKTLESAESLAKQVQKTNGKVFVVTSAEGINLLRLKTSPYQAQIKKLTSLYPVLDFVACNNTLYRFQKEGKSVELIDNTQVAPSAVEFVVDHLQKGWHYLSI